MKLPKESTDGLPRDGFDCITDTVIFRGLEGQKKVIFGYFSTFWQFSLTRSDNFSLFYFCIQLLGDDINQLSRD